MLYKCLDANGRSCNGGTAQWSLPTRNEDGTWTPGDWMPAVTGELVACENGYHLAEDAQVLAWLNARLFEAEYRAERVDSDDKVVVRECRLLREYTTWNERTARLFAVWCARQAFALVDQPDPRSVAACDVAERYANGEATGDELSAARSAARSAAWYAARSAAESAARSAAESAAWYAAESAAESAAWYAARSAARSAAESAAWYAAWYAAESAARCAQYRQLAAMLAGGEGE